MLAQVVRNVAPHSAAGFGIEDDSTNRKDVARPVLEMVAIGGQDKAAVGAHVRSSGFDLCSNATARCRFLANKLDVGVVPEIVRLLDFLKCTVGPLDELANKVHPRPTYTDGLLPLRRHVDSRISHGYYEAGDDILFENI